MRLALGGCCIHLRYHTRNSYLPLQYLSLQFSLSPLLIKQFLVYTYLVTNFGNPLELNHIVWSILLEVLFSVSNISLHSLNIKFNLYAGHHWFLGPKVFAHFTTLHTGCHWPILRWHSFLALRVWKCESPTLSRLMSAHRHLLVSGKNVYITGVVSLLVIGELISVLCASLTMRMPIFFTHPGFIRLCDQSVGQSHHYIYGPCSAQGRWY